MWRPWQRNTGPDKADPNMIAFLNSLKELKGLLFERLLTTVEQEKARASHLATIIEKEQHASLEVKKLTEELRELTEDRQSEVHHA